MNVKKLETKRLWIRQPEPNDFQYFQKWLSDPVLTEFLGGPRTSEGIKRSFEKIMNNWKEYRFGTGMIIYKMNDEVIGTCGINKIDIEGKMEFDLGYLIIKSYWRKGIASEAVKAVVDHVIKDFGLRRITAWPCHKNKPSVNVVEKLGFKFEKQISKELNGKQLDMSLYAAGGRAPRLEPWVNEPADRHLQTYGIIMEWNL